MQMKKYKWNCALQKNKDSTVIEEIKSFLTFEEGFNENILSGKDFNYKISALWSSNLCPQFQFQFHLIQLFCTFSTKSVENLIYDFIKHEKLFCGFFCVYDSSHPLCEAQKLLNH